MPWLVFQAFVGLIAFDLVSALFGFNTVHTVARSFPRRRRPGRQTTERICQAVAEAAVWYPKRAFCLQRSWTTSLLLRRHGIPSQLVIGFRPMPLDSHAWVEVDNVVVNDRPQYPRFYQILDRL